MAFLAFLVALSASAAVVAVVAVVAATSDERWSFEDADPVYHPAQQENKGPRRGRRKSPAEEGLRLLFDVDKDLLSAPVAMRAEEEEEENKFRKEKKEGDKEKASSESKGEKEGSDDVAGKQKIIKPPKDEKCENLLEEKACSAFEPLCGMFKLRAFVLCKKTCKLCPEDKPKGIKLIAELPELKGQAVLRQCAPRTTVYLTICVDGDNKLVKPDREYGLEIHDYAKIEKGGTKCTEIGPEFNPYNVLHGSPLTAMKKVGDLGNVRFLKKPPKTWPKEEERCKEDELGAYGLYNHVEMFTTGSCPLYKPIVVHEKKDDLGASDKKEDGNSGAALFCGRLICEEEYEKKKKGKGKEGKKEKKEGEKTSEAPGSKEKDKEKEDKVKDKEDKRDEDEKEKKSSERTAAAKDAVSVKPTKGAAGGRKESVDI